MNHLSIRRVQPTEAEKLLQLSRTTFFDAFAHQNTEENMAIYAAQAFTLAQMEKELNNPESEFYFIEDEQATAGYIKLNFGTAQAEFQDTDAIEIARIYVVASYQGKQLGERLIDHAVSIAKSRRLRYMWLGVWETNTNAIRFYERNGFKFFSKHYFMLGNDKQTDILMRREL